MSPDDRIRLRHMSDALSAAIRFTTGTSRADLERDEMLVFALVRAIEIVGEAASKLSSQTKDANPKIPWPLIISMRNRLVHAYFDIDLDILWSTATEAVPQLLSDIKPLLEH